MKSPVGPETWRRTLRGYFCRGSGTIRDSNSHRSIVQIGAFVPMAVIAVAIAVAVVTTIVQSL